MAAIMVLYMMITTLENQADAWKVESKNTIPHLLAQYSNIAQPMTTLN